MIIMRILQIGLKAFLKKSTDLKRVKDPARTFFYLTAAKLNARFRKA